MERKRTKAAVKKTMPAERIMNDMVTTIRTRYRRVPQTAARAATK